MADDLTNAQFATQLAQVYSDAADQVDAYIDANHDSLQQSGALNAFEAYEKQLTTYSEKFVEASNNLLFNGSEGCFTQLSDATNSIKQSLSHIQNVNKVVNIIASTFTLAENILTGNIKGVAVAVVDIVNAAKAPVADP
jgi:hypothetical protein